MGVQPAWGVTHPPGLSQALLGAADGSKYWMGPELRPPDPRHYSVYPLIATPSSPAFRYQSKPLSPTRLHSTCVVLSKGNGSLSMTRPSSPVTSQSPVSPLPIPLSAGHRGPAVHNFLPSSLLSVADLIHSSFLLMMSRLISRLNLTSQTSKTVELTFYGMAVFVLESTFNCFFIKVVGWS